MREHGRDPDPLQLPCLAGNSGISPTVASSLQCAESVHISARLLAKNLQIAPVAESPFPRSGLSI